MFRLSGVVEGFFERNIFERIIIYLFLSSFIVKLIFELMLGQWSFVQSQNKQWIFYGFLALDYILSVRKVVNIQVTVNPMSLFALLVFVMIAHGLFIGIVNHNESFVILNDTVPLLMIGLNILRMQSVYEYKKPIDFKFLFTACTLMVFGSTLFGYLAISLGKPSGTSIIVAPIYYPMIFAAFIMLRPFPKFIGGLAVAVFFITLSEINRTVMIFCILIVIGYTLVSIVRNPGKGILIILGITIMFSTFWISLSEDSPIYRRIMEFSRIDLSRRTGSIGERQAEMDAVQATITKRGMTDEWVGLGFGGLYEMRSTHQYIKNYGHAHYSWVWYNMRFGKIGYLYLTIMLLALIYNGYRSLQIKTELGLFTAFICISGLIYCGTYVNAVFLLSGIHFMYIAINKNSTIDDVSEVNKV